jgi:uroporphyrinogen-III synthase
MRTGSGGYRGRRVLTLESRRAAEMASLITTFGGEPIVAPALREAPSESNAAAVALCEALMRGEVDVLVLLTGVGTRELMRLAESQHGRQAFVQALGRTALVARGPKPVAALRECGLGPAVVAAPPHTWRELLQALDERAADVPLAGARVAVQEYGEPNPPLVRGLEARGALVTAVAIYRWLLPEDLGPLRQAIAALLRGEVDVVLLTSSVQLQHLLQIADTIGHAETVRAALRRTVVASIGPMTSEELWRQGLAPDFEPTSARIGVLVKETADRCDELVAAKRDVHLG